MHQRFDDVSDESIAYLVDRFYAKIRADARLGPIFEGVIAAKGWPGHLATMRAFWSSVMLTTGRYKGNPMLAHMRLEGVRPDDFEHWLVLFQETCEELFTDQIAAAFREKAGRIAQSLQFGMFYRPEEHQPRAVS